MNKLTSSERGFLVASKTIKKRLDEIKKPKKLKKNYRRTANYKQGYYDGLLFAECLLVLGEYPEQNKERIEDLITLLI